MKITKKLVALLLALGLTLGMGATAFAESDPPVLTNLLPFPDTQAFNQVLSYNPDGDTFFTRIRVQGADQYYRPYGMQQEQAEGILFICDDGVYTRTHELIDIGEGKYAVMSLVMVPTGLTYGPKFIKATLPDYTPGSWTGMVDLGVILNSESDVLAQDVDVCYFNGEPAANNRLKRVTNLEVAPNLVQSEIKYASALDAAKAGNSYIEIENPGTINAYAKTMRINGTDYTESENGNIGWQYRIYDDNGNKAPNCDKAGGEVFPVESGLNVVWAYGGFGILPDEIDPSLLN